MGDGVSKNAVEKLIDARERIAELEAALHSIIAIYENEQTEDAEGMDEIRKIARLALVNTQR